MDGQHSPRMPGDQITPATPSCALRWSPTHPLCLHGMVLAAILLRGLSVWFTPVITRDGMLYVGYARMINHGLWLDLVSDWFLFNPYPALMALVARCGIDYELAGQLISATAAGLAIWPLTVWIRQAFNERIAWLAALTYLFHPVLLRFSAHVLREGLYWGLLWWGVLACWSLAHRGGWWRSVLCGAITTAALLTRFEGIALYLLAGLWLWQAKQFAPRLRWRWFGAAVVVFPLTLIALNLVCIPQGRGWHGCGRWVNYASKLAFQSDVPVASPAKADPQHLAEMAARERARTAQVTVPTDVRQLAKSLPAWNGLGEPLPEVLRLQRFLILADDQANYLFLGRMINQAQESFLLPMLLALGWGVWRGGRSWSAARDWPLIAYSALLILMLLYNLSTEYILEARYLFCLMPLVFPWAAIGADQLWRDIQAAAVLQPRWGQWLPSSRVTGTALIVLALLKVTSGWESNDKQPQRLIGERLRHEFSHRLRIAGPEDLKRIGHYADADYFIIPRGLTDPVRDWLDHQSIDIVILEDEHDTGGLSPAQLPAGPQHPRYRPLFETQTRHSPIQVFRVLPPIQQVGS